MYCQPRYRVSRPPASSSDRRTQGAHRAPDAQCLVALGTLGKMFITIESAAGSVIAAPSPWIPRMTIKKVSELASPHAREARVKTAIRP